MPGCVPPPRRNKREESRAASAQQLLLPSGARVKRGALNKDQRRMGDCYRLTPRLADSDAASCGMPPGRLCVGVDGKWFDVTDWVPHHPGGDIIKEFVGKDATSVFHAWHSPHVLAKRLPCGTFESRCDDPAELAYRHIQRRAVAEGWYETDMLWVAWKVAIIGVCFTVAVTLVLWGATPFTRTKVAPFCLAAAWQQSGFLMHDLMHTQIFHSRQLDHALGTLAGTFMIGIGSVWWRDEHYEHHTFTNTYIPGVGNTDPQMSETIWAQDPSLFQFFGKEAPAWLQRCLTRVQHVVFLPALFLFGRIGICIDAMKGEQHPWEWLAYAGHWGYMALLLAQLPSWSEIFQFYFVIVLVEGVLTLQLLLSHYDKPFVDKEAVPEISVFRRQAAATKDIECSEWLDWFHGGLNLHLAHHLLPRLPRHRLRMVTQIVRETADAHGVAYEAVPWLEALVGTLAHLKSVASLVDAGGRYQLG
jgi:fatty acid desaturase